MSLDIWEVKYNFAYGKLTDEEWNFIDRYIESHKKSKRKWR